LSLSARFVPVAAGTFLAQRGRLEGSGHSGGVRRPRLATLGVPRKVTGQRRLTAGVGRHTASLKPHLSLRPDTRHTRARTHTHTRTHTHARTHAHARARAHQLRSSPLPSRSHTLSSRSILRSSSSATGQMCSASCCACENDRLQQSRAVRGRDEARAPHPAAGRAARTTRIPRVLGAV
jgi:hypothetical protein